MNLVLAGWWCTYNDHIARRPCFTESIPLYVEKRDEQKIAAVVDEHGPTCAPKGT